VPTEQLQLGTDDPLLREIRDELMPKEVRIDPLRHARGRGVLFDELPHASSRVGPVPIRCKKIGRPLRVLAFHVLGELAPKTPREKDITILAALALCDPELARL